MSSTVVEPLDMDVDPSGYSLVCGLFRDSLNANVGSDSTIISNVFKSGFAARYDPNGNVVWRHRISTSCLSITAGPDGSAYYGGQFLGDWDFDPGSNTFMLSSGQHARGYICKLNAAGVFQWAFKLGGSTTINVQNMRTDASGNLYVAGTFSGTQNFNPLGSPLTKTTEPSNHVAYVAKYNSNGICQWVSICKATISSNKWVTMLATDLYVTGDGKTYLAGQFRGNFIDPNTDEEYESRESGFDIFYCSLDSDGDFVFTNVHGSDLEESIESIIALDDGSVVITGYAGYSLYFDEDHFVWVKNAQEAFVARFDDSGDFQWLRSTNSKSNSNGADLLLGPNNQIWAICASKDSVGFIGSADTLFFNNNKGLNVFLVRYTESGDIIDIDALIDLDQFKNPRAGMIQNDKLWLTGMFSGVVDLNFGTNIHELTEDSLVYGFVSNYDICDEVEYQKNFLDTQICEGDSVLFLGDYFWEEGTYTDRVLQPDGCDSIDQLILKVKPNYTIYKDTLICDNQSFTFFGQTISETGDYTIQSQSIYGCDSNLVLHAMFNDIQAVFNAGSIHLASGWQGGTYQWYTCISNILIEIPGADSQFFEPLENGEYAVVSQVGECIDTSDCFNFFTLGYTELDTMSLTLYPNPASDMLWYTGSDGFESFIIYALTGQVLVEGELNNGNIPLKLPNGTYLFQAIKRDGSTEVQSVIIQR